MRIRLPCVVVFPTTFIVPHHLPVCWQLHTDSPAQLYSIWTWRNAQMRSEGSSPTGDRTQVARLVVQCSTNWATLSSLCITSPPQSYIYFHTADCYTNLFFSSSFYIFCRSFLLLLYCLSFFLQPPPPSLIDHFLTPILHFHPERYTNLFFSSSSSIFCRSSSSSLLCRAASSLSCSNRCIAFSSSYKNISMYHSVTQNIAYSYIA